MNDYLTELPSFFNISIQNLCDIISDDSKSKPFSIRSFQAIKSKKSSNMLHTEHIKEILKKFSLIDLDVDCNDYKKATELADRFADIYKEFPTKSENIILDFVLKDPICCLLPLEKDNPKISEFRSDFIDFLDGEISDNDVAFYLNRPSFKYTLFLYRLVCVSFNFDNKDAECKEDKKFIVNINAAYIKKTLNEGKGLEVDILKGIITNVYKCSDDEIGNLSNKALAKISDKINSGLRLNLFFSYFYSSTDIKLDYNNTIFENDSDFIEFIESVKEFMTTINDFKKSGSNRQWNKLNDDTKKIYNNKTLEDVLYSSLNQSPINRFYSFCKGACFIYILSDLLQSTNKSNMCELLSKYGIDTSTIKDELDEERKGPDYIMKNYYTCHKGYIWWKLYFERSYNKYFFPTFFINDSITCKMLKREK